MKNIKGILLVIALFFIVGIVPVLVSLIPMWVEVIFFFGGLIALFIWAIKPERKN